MSNVVNMFQSTPPPNDFNVDAESFMDEYFIPWARENDIDTSTKRFKMNATGIMIMIKTLLMDDD